MAVFAWVAGDPFNYEMDEQPFIEDVASGIEDVWNFLADTRLTSQSTMYSALTYRTADVRRWITHGDVQPSSSQFIEAAMIAVVVGSYQVIPYTNPYTAPIAFALDAYNIYRYFD